MASEDDDFTDTDTWTSRRRSLRQTPSRQSAKNKNKERKETDRRTTLTPTVQGKRPVLSDDEDFESETSHNDLSTEEESEFKPSDTEGDEEVTVDEQEEEEEGNQRTERDVANQRAERIVGTEREVGNRRIERKVGNERKMVYRRIEREIDVANTENDVPAEGGDSGSDLSEIESDLDPPTARTPRRRRGSAKPKPVKRDVEKDLIEWHPELDIDWESLRKKAQDRRSQCEAAEQPEGLVNVSLLPYQKEGLKWFSDQEKTEFRGGILADEMGMGKVHSTYVV
jgi:SNF2 family DNA or RNA helicase